MLRQYFEMKSRAPDAILFYRMGDFYEMFFEDAVVAARALEIALSGPHEVQVGRAYVNLYAMHVAERRFAEGERYFTEGVAYCDDHDIGTYSIFLRSERTSMLERTGRWDEVQWSVC